jgi:general secretion pathway protein G
MLARTKKTGFTLVEILIVVIILGILAAIVIPQFSNASTTAKLNSLTSDLQTVRSQVALYAAQHNDTPPTVANFVLQMTGQTDITGATNGTGFGPYLQAMPNNPFTATATVGSGANGTSAWYTDGAGAFRANDTAAHAAY